MKNSNRMIIVTDCLEDCPCCRYDNGGGYGSPYYECLMMDKIISDQDQWDLSKWRYGKDKQVPIHPKCPLKVTSIAKPQAQTFKVEDDDSNNEENEESNED
jgi:hypothetical protein